VALIDLGLPVMDGFELARRIQGLAGPAIRLGAVTGYGQESDRTRSASAGFQLHLTKPVELGDIIAAVEEQQLPGADRD
jgi:CheY-like chemotaxis protein